MIQEALEYFAGLACKSRELKEVEGADPRATMFIDHDGKVTKVAREIPPRNHHAKSLADMISLANRFAETEGYYPFVWFLDDEINLILDDHDHRLESVVFSLQYSDKFKAVLGLKGKIFEQKAFIRLLRIDLAGTLAPAVLLDKVRRLKFENGQTVSSAVGRNKESLGREIQSRVESADGEIPEEVILDCPMYKSAGMEATYSIRCAVEIDPGQASFQLIPLPDEIERVGKIAMEDLRKRLLEELNGAPCYYGRP